MVPTQAGEIGERHWIERREKRPQPMKDQLVPLVAGTSPRKQLPGLSPSTRADIKTLSYSPFFGISESPPFFLRRHNGIHPRTLARPASKDVGFRHIRQSPESQRAPIGFRVSRAHA